MVQFNIQAMKNEKLFSHYLAPIKNKKPFRNITLTEVFKLVSGDAYRVQTERVRKDESLKKQILAYVTPSGTFRSRGEKELIDYSGIICIDLDHIDITLKDTLAGDNFLNPALIFVSPRGEGLKVFIDIEAGTVENHLKYYTALREYFSDIYQLKIDAACKDVPRACFLCHDPEAYFSNGSICSEKLLNILPDIPEPPKQDPEPAIIPEIHRLPSEELNKLPSVHDRAVRALKNNDWQQDGEHWTRPKKDPKAGNSAIYNVDPKDGLYKFTNFSDNGHPFKIGGYTDVQIVCLLEYGDLWTPCIKELTAKYLPRETKQKTEVKQAATDPVTTKEPPGISAELAGRIIDLSQNEPDIQFLFEKNGVGCIPQGDIVVLKGKGKHGKTTVIAIWITALFKGEFFGFKALKTECRVLYIDTEQNRANTLRLTRKVHSLCGYPINKSQPNFVVINLRPDNPQERNQYMDEAINYYKPDLLIIDGAKDLISNGDINDTKTCGETVQKMMTISQVNNLAIITILHENKTDTNLRGHIGTELLNKCAENWQTVKNTDGSFEVKQIECRNQPADDFGYTLDENVLPVPSESAPRVSQKEIIEIKKQTTLRQCLPPMKRSSYTELTNLFSEYYPCKSRTATDTIATYLKRGYLIHESDGNYKYNYQKEVH